MSDIRGPERYQRDPYEHIKIEPIEDNKFEEEKENKKKNNEKGPTIMAAFIYLFKKFINTLLKTPKKHPITSELKEFRELLVKLTKEDLSEDLSFLNSLTFKWLDILAKYEEEPKKTNLEAVKLFFDEIYAYPAGQPYSLGYYLTQHAGYKWIPFPFMEILKNLHLDFQQRPDNSQLKKWIEILDSLLQ